MKRPSKLARNVRQLAAAGFLALTMLSGGFSFGSVKAAVLPPEGEGLVLVPQAGAPSPAKAGEVSGFTRARIVDFATARPAGTIIISARHHALFYVLGNGKAARYNVATARKGFEWSGAQKVSAKVRWPNWHPPVEMRKRHPELPVFMAGGPKNPLGARAIYLGSSIYRIHGTNEPASIGKSASSGCIRMLNADVEELYQKVKVGDAVFVM